MIIYGRNVVITALERNIPLKKIHIAANVKGDSIKRIKQIVGRTEGLEIKWLPPQFIDKEAGAGNVHQGVLAHMDEHPYVELAPFIDELLQKKREPILVICDQITDPHNLGEIIRSAECAGADGVIIPDQHSAQVTTTVYKTSAGAAFTLPIIKTVDLKEAIDFLHKKKFGVFALAGDADMSYTELHYENPTAIVIGSEGLGIRKAIRNNCDESIKLPIHGTSESLNASVTCGIVLYHILEKRSSK